MNMNSHDKVAERREQKIANAVEKENWNEVQHQLEMPEQNAKRKDRYHGKMSLDYHYSDDKKTLYDFVSHGKNPLKTLLDKEANKKIREAIASLSPTNQFIVLGLYFWGMTATEIANELLLCVSSVTRRRDKALKQLKPLLSEYFNN